MDRRLNIVTLGVPDLDRAVRFYRDGLGWKPAVEVGDFLLFEAGGVAFAQNVASPEEVDRVIASACAAGATLLRAASAKDWGGYSGYFADPDRQPWEVAHNPHFRLYDRGRLVLLRQATPSRRVGRVACAWTRNRTGDTGASGLETMWPMPRDPLEKRRARVLIEAELCRGEAVSGQQLGPVFADK